MAAGIESFLSEIAIVPYNFAPTGWAFCDGQILAISSNTALFSLLGTAFGGNGTTNFALPNFQGCVPLGPSSTYFQGTTGGAPTVTLEINNIPAHTHLVTNPLALPAGGTGTDVSPVNEYLAASGTDDLYSGSASASATLPCLVSAVTAADTGGNGTQGTTPYNNMQPYLTMTFIIALEGIFPPRS